MAMRLIIKSMLALLVVAVVIPFTLPLKDGGPLLKWSDIKMPGAPHIPELPKLSIFNNSGSQEVVSTPVTTYKWRDSEGNWHISDTPPNNIVYEMVTVDPNTNVIQALKSPPVVEKHTALPAIEEPTQPTYSPAMAYNPEKVSEVMDSARNVENLLQQRKEQQDKLLQAIQ